MKINSRVHQRSLCALMLMACLISTPPAKAFLTLGETGELTPSNSYKLGLEPQLKWSKGNGGNIGVFFDKGINDEWSARATLGSGQTDFWGSLSAKWIPIPDFESQPAIGLRSEVIFGREESDSFMIVRASPLLSKGFEIESGKVTPYVSLPVGLWIQSGDSYSISQFIAGTEVQLLQFQGMRFGGEIGLDVTKTFSYISGFISWEFDTYPR